MKVDSLAELLLVALKKRGEADGYRVFKPLADVAFELDEADWRRVHEAADALASLGLVEIIHKLRGSAARITPRGVRRVTAAPWMDSVLEDLEDLTAAGRPEPARRPRTFHQH